MAIGDTAISVSRCASVLKTKISDYFVTLWLSKKILKGRWFAKQNSPLHSLEKQEKKRDFSKNVLQINHLQLCKFPCPPKSPNGEFGGFCVFQTFGMRQFQILRFAEKVVNPCNSPSKQFHIIQALKCGWRYLKNCGASCSTVIHLSRTADM